MLDAHIMTQAQRHCLLSAAGDLHEQFRGVFGEETIQALLLSSYAELAARATVDRWLVIGAERFTRQRLRALAHAESHAAGRVPSVLFLCVHNAGRSQMALGWFTHLAKDRAIAWSGGADPVAVVNPEAVAAMAEVGIDISQEFPKPWTDEFVLAADVVVTMGCGDACPLLPGKHYEDWELDDPSGKTLEEIRPIRDQIRDRVTGDQAKVLLPTVACWPALEHYGVDTVWKAIQRRSAHDEDDGGDDADVDLRTPEWQAFTRPEASDFANFTARKEPPPLSARSWLQEVVLVSRLREVSALFGFTRIDSPEWDILSTDAERVVQIARTAPTWVPCAETRGEGIFLRFREDQLAAWVQHPDVRDRGQMLAAGHLKWRADRRLAPVEWPGPRYVLLHTLAHVLIREFALECGYNASGIAERIYARRGDQPMAGIMLYTAAPDSEGTLGGLVSLGRRDRLGGLIDQALDSARLCTSDPLCADHDPRDRGELFGAACHACLFASETSCEHGNHYLDRALLVDTITGGGTGFLSR